MPPSQVPFSLLPQKSNIEQLTATDAGSATRPQICPSSPQPCLACKPASAFPYPPPPDDPSQRTGRSLTSPSPTRWGQRHCYNGRAGAWGARGSLSKLGPLLPDQIDDLIVLDLTWLGLGWVSLKIGTGP
ncbi:hypothetical protein FVEG_15650 [Fusarium verticillioides 7600]|uniref:Uncharacterized protein n=1 Tax=Gibberella moniliformis (strain M3125 / FGSC 7600) TaxID=334819 RepID=W7MA35_GIBM7|nr:hypothetical protein FVEG_15650 [Fusarium verticillioides 7600]EWG44425.1 hypothetical protein FVEG_15650 [Fusarium verticillioides 7600]